MEAAPELRIEMCPSFGLSHSSAEGQRRASHSPCELGTTRSRLPCTRRTGDYPRGVESPRGDVGQVVVYEPAPVRPPRPG